MKVFFLILTVAAALQITMPPEVGVVAKRDGIVTCGYFDGDESQFQIA
jgi:hypothetical protein